MGFLVFDAKLMTSSPQNAKRSLRHHDELRLRSTSSAIAALIAARCTFHDGTCDIALMQSKSDEGTVINEYHIISIHIIYIYTHTHTGYIRRKKQKYIYIYITAWYVDLANAVTM